MTDTTETVVETTAPDANVTEQVTTPESSPGAVDTSDKSAKPNGAQKRIDELTWHRRNLERDVNYWRDLALKNQQQPAVETKPQVATAPKKLADFDYDEDKYADYVAEVAAEKAAAKLQEKQSHKETESSKRAKVAKFRELEAKAKVDIADYEDVAYYARIDSHVAELVMGMDEGPRIAYYLGKNEDVASRLNSLSESEVAFELGRIDQRLAFEREQAKAKPVSKAPPPPPKIDATEPAVDKDPSQMSDAEFAKWRKRQIAQRR